MNPAPLTDTYTVSPQIAPEDVPRIKAMGFVTVINNRPDSEVPAELASEVLRAAVEAAGLTYVDNPFSHAAFSLDIVDRQMAALDASDGPVFAYCASGNRCSVLWAMGKVRAGALSVEDAIAAAGAQGYDLSRLAPQLSALAAGRG